MYMKTNRQEAIDDGFFSYRQEDKIYILECTTRRRVLFIQSENNHQKCSLLGARNELKRWAKTKTELKRKSCKQLKYYCYYLVKRTITIEGKH